MKFCRIIFCLWLLVCFFPIGIHADIQLPSILSDNMVLQQNAKVRFWGKARPGEKILVKTSWDHKKYKVTALANGHWELMIQTPAATSGQSVMLKGDNKIRINNILIGEVCQAVVWSLKISIRCAAVSTNSEPPVHGMFCVKFRVRSVLSMFCSTNFTVPSPSVTLLIARFRFGSEVRLKAGR